MPDFLVSINTIILAIARITISRKAVNPMEIFVLQNKKNPPTHMISVNAMEIAMEKNVL